MKFNLKNRPMFDTGVTYTRKEIREWFEGFEKELRDIVDNACAGDKIADYIKREILGE